MKTIQCLSLSAVLLTLVACGSGDGADNSATPQATPQTTPLATSLPENALRAVKVETTGDRLEQVIVDEVTQPAPGIKEYKLSAIMCGGTGLLLDQQVTVSYPGGTAVAASAPMGMSGFNQCRINSGNKFRVQLPDAEAFDPAKLQVAISANQQTETAPVRLIKVDLYRVAGRASHQELIALNTLYPVAGEQVVIRAALGGNIKSPTFALIGEDGNTLQKDKLNAEGDGANSGSFQFSVTVPSKPFRIAITANEGESEASRWVTDTYVPQPKPIQIDFSENAVMDRAVRELHPRITGAAAADGILTLRLFAPKGYTTDWATKQLTVKKDDPIDLAFKLTAIGSTLPGKQRLQMVLTHSAGTTLISQGKFIDLTEKSE